MSTNELVYELNKHYIDTGKYQAIGDVAKRDFIQWCMYESILSPDTPFQAANWIIEQAWYFTVQVRSAFYKSLVNDGLWQAGYDAMTQEQRNERLLKALQQQQEAQP